MNPEDIGKHIPEIILGVGATATIGWMMWSWYKNNFSQMTEEERRELTGDLSEAELRSGDPDLDLYWKTHDGGWKETALNMWSNFSDEQKANIEMISWQRRFERQRRNRKKKNSV